MPSSCVEFPFEALRTRKKNPLATRSHQRRGRWPAAFRGWRLFPGGMSSLFFLSFTTPDEGLTRALNDAADVTRWIPKKRTSRRRSFSTSPPPPHKENVSVTFLPVSPTCLIDFSATRFTEFFSFFPSFTGFYRVLPSFTEFYWVLPCFTGFLLGITGFYQIPPSFTGFYRVLPSFTGFY